MIAIEEMERELLSNFFELEGLGITSDECIGNNNFLEYFKKYSDQVSFENGYVTAPSPLKTTVQNITDNYSTALKRLMNLYIHLEQNTTKKGWYSKTLKQYEDKTSLNEWKIRLLASLGRTICHTQACGNLTSKNRCVLYLTPPRNAKDNSPSTTSPIKENHS
ncbi:unnamed protein product [Haemonchus placei]|uniref:DUF4806 domain-containing protein n=1 Tax=Haemonchus placei TaxID=6290 RepID=A0A0N4VVK1_HAEPC|nr:unnamed protein product [Haemonchus placei]